MSSKTTRRSVLRGMLGGGAITVGLPFLECFLDDNGTALADGAPVPVRFGTWFWGLGMTQSLFTPDKVGAHFDLKEELAAIKQVSDDINLFSNYATHTDGMPALCHYSGWVMVRCGEAPSSRESLPAPSIDVIIGDHIGEGARFRSLEAAADGSKRSSFSFRSADAINPPEISPVAFYQRVFGPEFQDPNSADFKPNPEIMLRKSVLSAVLEDSADLSKRLGAADRARLDEYFTSLRGLENRLAAQLEKPPPAAGCRKPPAPPVDPPVGVDADLVMQRHRLLTDILVAAVACNQTRIFNMAYSSSFAQTTRLGFANGHHAITHEEILNEAGYQPTHSWFIRKAMDEWAYFVRALKAVREGAGTLLDNTLVFAHSDHGEARTHTLNAIPMMTAGRAGGRLRTGLHVDGTGKEATQVGYTLMHAMGLNKQEWGGRSMKTSSVVGQILA